MSAAAPNPTALPGPLPEGERVLWSGAPAASAIARHALHERLVAVYFVLVAVYTATHGVLEARPRGEIAYSLGLVALAALAVFGLTRLFAHLVQRTTAYTITNRRVAMRVGVALPITLNVPFTIVQGAGLRTNADGTGDIPLALSGTGRIGYLHLWPHARPWRLRQPEPMLRGVPEAREVAAILARAIAEVRGDLAPAAIEPERAAPETGLAPAVPQLAA